jgi:hypothetical protein
MSKARELAELGAVYDSGALSNRNIIINGAMQVAQRGTSSTGLGATSGYYTVDRMSTAFSGTAGRLTMTQESITDLPGFTKCVKLACTTADTSIAAAEYLLFSQNIEGQNLQHIAKGTSSAKKLTVSFYVKGNAAATYVCEMQDSNSREISKSFSVTTSWTRVILTYDGDTDSGGTIVNSNANGIGLIFWLHAGSNFNSGSAGDLNTSWSAAGTGTRAAGADSFFDSTSRTLFITGLQMEVGSEATPFEHRSFGDELLRCQRYTYIITGDDDDMTGIMGYGESASAARFPLLYSVNMRTSPSFTLSGTCRAQGGTADGANFTSGLAIVNANTNHTGSALRVTGTSNLANDRGYNLQIKADGTTLTFDAEL